MGGRELWYSEAAWGDWEGRGEGVVGICLGKVVVVRFWWRGGE